MSRFVHWSGLVLAFGAAACSGKEDPPSNAQAGGAGTLSSGGQSSGGSAPSAGATSQAGAAGSPGAGGGANAAAGGSNSTAGAAAFGGSATLGGAPAVTCSQATGAYQITRVELDATLAPQVGSGFGSSLFAQVPVAVHPTSGAVFVGLTLSSGGGTTVIVPATAGASAPVVSVPGATVGGIAVTKDGFATLLFDPNTSVDDRTWAAVARFDAAGKQLFSTDLFRSANLEDDGTKGAPGTSRFGYVASSDQLVAYFGHTEMIQAVRHQGGYVATLDTAGKQTVVGDWWGSHNLDQRLIVSGAQVGMLGLGDAYPKGVFFAFLASRPQTRVIYTLAGNGQGTTNGQLGGLVDLDDAVAVPFITNDSISQTLTPGDWPDIDQAIATQISTAAANGNKLGLMLAPKMGAIPAGDLKPVWVDVALTSGAHLERLKSARYGSEGLILLAWAEATGSSRNATRSYFTMVVDRAGAICQPKTPLAAENAFTAGDDFAVRPDGSVVWSNVVSNRVSVMTLLPGG